MPAGLGPDPFPASPIRGRHRLYRLWEVLAEEDRQRTLQLLSRLVAQQTPAAAKRRGGAQ